MAKVKEYVPIVEPKSTSYLEIVELSRTVTPHPVFKKDTVFVRVKKICRGNPAETFELRSIGSAMFHGQWKRSR